MTLSGKFRRAHPMRTNPLAAPVPLFAAGLGHAFPALENPTRTIAFPTTAQPKGAVIGGLTPPFAESDGQRPT